MRERHCLQKEERLRVSAMSADADALYLQQCEDHLWLWKQLHRSVVAENNPFLWEEGGEKIPEPTRKGHLPFCCVGTASKQGVSLRESSPGMSCWLGLSFGVSTGCLLQITCNTAFFSVVKYTWHGSYQCNNFTLVQGYIIQGYSSVILSTCIMLYYYHQFQELFHYSKQKFYTHKTLPIAPSQIHPEIII